jgi:2-amino-4-hydroxy-6-hydroxymethyldihydropteridine diphosphokinase
MAEADSNEWISAALSLGANQGDVVGAFVYALQTLRVRGAARRASVSSVYRTAPWGKTDQPEFLNIAALFETRLTARALLAACLAVETERGRVRREKWAPRTLDIDILDYGGATVDEPDLRLPHPYATERAFVLIPLCEIAPNLELGARTVAEWTALCDAAGVVRDEAATARLREGLAASEGK